MALTKRHVGHGKFVVEEDGKRIAGPVTKEQAEARIVAPPIPPKPAIDPDKAFALKVAADLRRPLEEESVEIRAVLAKRRNDDEVRIIMQAIEPSLKAGSQAGRRERIHFLPPKAVKAA